MTSWQHRREMKFRFRVESSKLLVVQVSKTVTSPLPVSAASMIGQLRRQYVQLPGACSVN